MSTILKALQKLEKDKASRQTKMPELTGAITHSLHRRKTSPPWVLPLSISMAALISILVTYAVMGGFSRSVFPALKPNNYTPKFNSPLTPQSSNTLMPEQKPAKPESSMTRRMTPSGLANKPLSIPKPPSSHEIPSNQHKAATVQQPEPDIPAQQTSSDLTNERKVQQEIHVSTPQPHLKVSGIAWQKDSSSRIAVINGISLIEGGSIEGARIKEIFQDKVRVSHNGKEFDIYLGKDQQR